MEIREISVVENFEAARELMHEHWLETESTLSDGPHPVREMYQVAEDSGLIIAFGAFEGACMIGYCAAMVVPHLHYGFLYAHHDVLFVRKMFRGSPLGVRLVRRLENKARERGAQWLVWHSKPGSTFDEMLPRLGYALEEHIFRKDL